MNNKKPKPIGRTIKLCRQYNGLSQSELGEKVGFAKKTAGTRIGQYEGERIYAKPQITAKLAMYLLSEDAKMICGETVIIDGGYSIR